MGALREIAPEGGGENKMDLWACPAVVTGAASGLGAETARHLVDAGAKVALIDIDAEGVPRDRLAEQLALYRTLPLGPFTRAVVHRMRRSAR